MDWMKWMLRGVFVASGWMIAVGCDDDADMTFEGEFACGSERCDAATEYCDYPGDSCEQGVDDELMPSCSSYPDGCEPGCECLEAEQCWVRDGGVHTAPNPGCG